MSSPALLPLHFSSLSAMATIVEDFSSVSWVTELIESPVKARGKKRKRDDALPHASASSYSSMSVSTVMFGAGCSSPPVSEDPGECSLEGDAAPEWVEFADDEVDVDGSEDDDSSGADAYPFEDEVDPVGDVEACYEWKECGNCSRCMEPAEAYPNPECYEWDAGCGADSDTDSGNYKPCWIKDY